MVAGVSDKAWNVPEWRLGCAVGVSCGKLEVRLELQWQIWSVDAAIAF